MKLPAALLALPALAMLAACASEPPAPPPPPPMAAVAPPPPPMATAPAMSGRYVGTARLASGPRGCARTIPVSAMVNGDNVALMSGRRAMTVSDTRMDGGMVMGSTMRGACRYDVTLRSAPARSAPPRARRAR